VRSGTARKRPQIAPETVALIQQIVRENRLWGAERIRGVLLKLGLRVGKRTVQRDRRGVRPPRRSGQTWATFLSTHAHEIWACDFLPVIDVGFRTLYAFFIVELGSRRVVHVGVMREPTDAWVAQQLREATPLGIKPRFLIRDNDSKFGAQFARVADTTRIEIVRTPFRAPRANAICERMIGTLRRELLDRILIVNERHLRQVLTTYLHHFNEARPHRALAQLAPAQADTQPPHVINLVDYQVRRRPILDGLTSEYQIIA